MNEINIQPDSGVYSTYRRLSYDPWHAIAEYIDNSSQSYSTHIEAISATDGSSATFIVQITYDPRDGTLSIFDNANGMDREELSRAVQLNRPPIDRSGRSEFGMGLKMASCWLGSRWSIRTKRLGSTEELEVKVDVGHLEEHKPSAIPISAQTGLDESTHYTLIEVTGLHRTFKGRTLGKIKDHLASIYRRDIAMGAMELRWNEEILTFEPSVAHVEKHPDGTETKWEKQFEFTPQSAPPVKGMVRIMKDSSGAAAGIHVFRRGRLVQGGHGEGLKPSEIFGRSNDYPGKRILIELDMDSWPASMTKDAIDWSGHWDDLIEGINKNVSDYVIKAQTLRKADDGTRDTELIVDTTKESLSSEEMESALITIEHDVSSMDESDVQNEQAFRQLTDGEVDPIPIPVGTDALPQIKLFLVGDKSENDPYAAFEFPSDEVANIAVNLRHPFVDNVIGSNDEALNRYLLILYADALVERELKRQGKTKVPIGSFRLLKDKILRGIKPPH